MSLINLQDLDGGVFLQPKPLSLRISNEISAHLASQGSEAS